jgi:hypothetical protein
MAIADVLESDPELSALATGGVHWRSAPSGTQPPLVVIDKSTGSRMYTFDGPPLHSTSWLVKGVGFVSDAEEIDKRCRALLDGTLLAGVDLRLRPIPDNDVSYQEDTSGEVYDHVGTEYRMVNE